MKKSTIKIWFVVFFTLILTTNNITAQVGIGTLTPNSSAMLDVQSTSKGVLVPRMTTLQRTAISSPATGLLVFDTTTQSFWFYSAAWVELVSGSSIVDTDGDTKIEVEQSADEDKIRFSTANPAGDASVERMSIGNNGEILMGSDLAVQATTFFEIGSDGVIKLGNKGASTLTGGVLGGLESDETGLENYTKITTDGSLSYVGNATRWEDLRIPTTSLKDRIVDMPKWDPFINDGQTGPGLFLHWFEDKTGGEGDAEQELFFTAQMPHGWKEGSDLQPHVHWTTKDDASGKNVEWGLEYVWANVTSQFSSTTNIIYTDNTIGTPGIRQHNISTFPKIDGAGHLLSSMLICRVFRHSSGGNDTFDGKQAGLIEIDFHYQVDSDGSNQEYTKE